MKLKSVLALIGLVIIVLLLASWFKQGIPEQQAEGFLPDHITEIEGTTLPRAIQEARIRGKRFVRISDPDGNTITVDLGQQTQTIFTLSDPGEEPLKVLQSYKVPVEKAFGIVDIPGESYSFSLPEVNYAQIASIVYEISVRLFHIASTTNWVIDIE
ncbi:hypothetical protein COV06_00855 [Candidatus Uhrbacteria bacterium CG10_big_fil_rev_8_21_14_0_10_50_16]|uniref:Uncharacterized protein n=1 Tax=Candidatus Uhrbacteria bacterium CG10_big_fil_rev_8_21_14_0_10_50_16 TaxID=1975039 RepID=A0A2H0RQA5_9BACT|nr:MAG: hypothetical protein COV06_00855 [Candidatus Uhrbacteria bacterium CG10_big_fil_rev_8_21_14_0_10_50_16]